MEVRIPVRTLPLLLALALAPGCGSSGEVSQIIADFLLDDVNPNSATFARMVSPRDQLGKVSAWYFAHAT
ncbi:MAG: hypothetical protein ACT4PV_10555 [Planctomycetaceae bacterium]